MKKFSDYLVEYTSNNETEQLEEFFGVNPSKSLNQLSARGFNCKSPRDVVEMAVSRMNGKFSNRQIQEIIDTFFDGTHCKETLAHSMFTRMN